MTNRDELRREYAVRIFAALLPGFQDKLEKDTHAKVQTLAQLSVDLANTLIDEIRKAESKAG